MVISQTGLSAPVTFCSRIGQVVTQISDSSGLVKWKTPAKVLCAFVLATCYYIHLSHISQPKLGQTVPTGNLRIVFT